MHCRMQKEDGRIWEIELKTVLMPFNIEEIYIFWRAFNADGTLNRRITGKVWYPNMEKAIYHYDKFIQKREKTGYVVTLHSEDG